MALNIRKSTGWDNILSKALKTGSNELSQPLTSQLHGKRVNGQQSSRETVPMNTRIVGP